MRNEFLSFVPRIRFPPNVLCPDAGRFQIVTESTFVNQKNLYLQREIFTVEVVNEFAFVNRGLYKMDDHNRVCSHERAHRGVLKLEWNHTQYTIYTSLLYYYYCCILITILTDLADPLAHLYIDSIQTPK